MATDTVTTIEDRLWAILLASADFTAAVRAGNRVSRVNPARQRLVDAKPTARQAADFPEVRIERGRTRYNPFAGAVTFATFQGTPAARIRQRTQDVTITITTDGQGDVTPGQLRSMVEDLIESAGPQLGIPAAVSLVQEIASDVRTSGRSDPMGPGKRQVVVTVSLLCRSSVQ